MASNAQADEQGARSSKIPATRGQLSQETTHLHQRIDDEVRGAEERLVASLRDEVARLEDLIRALYARFDGYLADVGRADRAAADIDQRIAELVELREQPRSAERAEARRLADLEARLRSLEERR